MLCLVYALHYSCAVNQSRAREPMKRTLPRQRLHASPLVHVLAQVRFPAVTDMADRVEAIRGRLTAFGFLRFEPSSIQNVVVEAGGQNLRIDTVPRWDFLDRDDVRSVVLTRDFVLLQTTRYETYEEFLDLFRAVLQTVAEEAKPTLVERTGLRYVDLVRPQPGERLADYLRPGLVGYAFDDVPATLEVRSSLTPRVESIAATAVGQLAIRCFQRTDGAFLPPDLMPSNLAYEPERLPRAGETVSILDIDHSSARRLDFDVPAIERELEALHDATDIVFRGAVTPYAMSVWRQEESA